MHGNLTGGDRVRQPTGDYSRQRSEDRGASSFGRHRLRQRVSRGGLMSTVAIVDGRQLYVSVAHLDLTDATSPQGGVFVPLIGIRGHVPVPVRILPLPPGRYVVRREFSGRPLPAPSIPEDWDGAPEDHPFSSLPSHERLALAAFLEVTGACVP
jgi:hypothetical protein